MGGRGGRQHPHRVARRKGRMPRRAGKTQEKSSDAGEVPWSRRRGEKWHRGATREKKMLKNNERSRNVHENKQKGDNFTEKKDDISAQLNDILHKSSGILLKSSAFLSLSNTGKRNPRFRM